MLFVLLLSFGRASRVSVSNRTNSTESHRSRGPSGNSPGADINSAIPSLRVLRRLLTVKSGSRVAVSLYNNNNRKEICCLMTLSLKESSLWLLSLAMNRRALLRSQLLQLLILLCLMSENCFAFISRSLPRKSVTVSILSATQRRQRCQRQRPR